MFIVIEGLLGAGKTTVFRYLKGSFDGVFVPEWLLEGSRFWYRGTWNRPVYRIREELKCSMVKDCLSKLVVMERNYICYLAHEYSLSKSGRVSSYEDAVGWYETAKESGRLVEPDVYLMMDVSVGTSLSRIRNRTHQDAFWLEPSVLASFKRYYSVFFERYEPHVDVKIINANESLDRVLSAAYDTISSLTENRCPSEN